MKADRNAHGERMTEAQEQQLERRLKKLCQVQQETHGYDPQAKRVINLKASSRL